MIIIFGLLIFACTFASLFIVFNKWEIIGVVGIIGNIVIALSMFMYSNLPTAMDVYKNRTELKYEGAFNSEGVFVPTDSTVVWKE